MKLIEALQECTLALLRRIAANHALPLRDDLLRAEISAIIVERLSDSTYVQTQVAGLSPDESRLVAYLASHGWRGKAFLLERQFSAQSSGSPSASACQALLQKGMLYRTFGVLDGWRGELYHVPEELRPALQSAQKGDQAGLEVALDAVAPPHLVDLRDVVADVFGLMSFLRRGDRHLQQGGLTKADLGRLEMESSGGQSARDPGEAGRRWRFLIRLCLAGGWIWRDGQILRPGKSAVRLLSEPRSMLRQRLLERYLKERSLSDLADTGRFRLPSGSRQLDEPASRQMLLHHLEELAGARWTTEDAFVAALRQLNPDFLREDYASIGSAVVDAFSEVELHGVDSWQMVEAEWIRHLLRGPLYWLGVVRWGRSASGERLAFQLASREAVVPSPGTGSSFLVRSDGALTASWAADPGVLYQIEPYLAFRESVKGQRVYRISESSVRRGVDQGGGVEALMDLLSRTWGDTLPPDLLEEVRRWAHSYGSLCLEGAVLLTSNSEDELLEVYGLPGVSDCLSERAGPLSYRVLPARFHQLLDALRRAGRPPMIDPTAGSTRARAITGEPSLVRECLFAILVVRSLYGQLEIESGDEAQRALEAVLGPEESDEVARRAQEASRKIRSLGERGW